MKPIILTAAVLLIAGVSVPASTAAPTAGFGPDYDICIAKSDGTNTAWSECGSALIDREDAALNADWKRVFPNMEVASKKALLEEQRAWISFKEKACRIYQTGDWGREGQVLDFPTCLARVIEARRKELLAYGSNDVP